MILDVFEQDTGGQMFEIQSSECSDVTSSIQLN
jgi:hypothetical protein